MDHIANLADVMLVLAVGIMLALVINWNVDLAVVAAANKEDTSKTEEISENDEIKLDENDLIPEEGELDSDKMLKLGTVYFDETTGKYYLIENNPGG